MASLCRYDGLATHLAFLDGAVLDPPLPPCGEAADYSVRLVRGDDGGEIDLRFDVCADHERDFGSAEGYDGSWLIPART
jgi:hypothetical protein